MGKSKTAVAVFWDLTYAHPGERPNRFLADLRRFSSNCGKVAYIAGYIDRRFHFSEAEMVGKLEAGGVDLFYCPLNGRKPTIHHTMEEHIAFHVALDHPETTAVVFLTGGRDFTYCSQTLRNKGIRVEVLIQKNDRLCWAKGSKTYWPRCLSKQTPKGKNGMPKENGGTVAGGKNGKKGGWGGAVVTGQKGNKKGETKVKGNKKKKKKK
ncbi:hypothetical protein FA13DRAFT_1736961 [Coprinellus micaceus]|uniref:NYN domain-containing protein n=1 Tax=Coprinellus micaceus TaxID=71717 RepID=A0A4Y7SYN0_COPMI|nr:hypothetical protein FA13DRAFT_1736961 [Coprinellus micaceus]